MRLAPAEPWPVDASVPELVWGMACDVDPLLAVHRGQPVERLRPLLDAGVRALDQARRASEEMARLSAVVAGSLATFARCRPGALMDRQPG